MVQLRISYTKNTILTTTVKGGYIALDFVPNIGTTNVGNPTTVVNGQSTSINAKKIDGNFDNFVVETRVDFDAGESIELTGIYTYVPCLEGGGIYPMYLQSAGPDDDILTAKGLNSNKTGTYKRI
ncbi:hypothetical protein PVAG01_04425 [Phlyctema vagabunda]|uniref:Allorecognition 2 n=1 Tax=Phlyctema vagabunda TaxID=108571 RepID=A0ABR4PP76_9HELO